jgi:hypothetical protein
MCGRRQGGLEKPGARKLRAFSFGLDAMGGNRASQKDAEGQFK